MNSLRKIYVLLTKRQRIEFVVLTLLLIFGMALEILVLALLIPIIKILTSENEFLKLKENEIYYEFLKKFSYDEFNYYGLSFLVLLFVLKNIFLIFLNFIQNRYSTNLIAHVASKLFNIIVNKEFNFHLNKNSSELVKNFHIDIGYFGALFQSILMIFIELSLSISVLIALFLFDTKSAIISSFIVLILSTLVYFLTRKKISSLTSVRKIVEDEEAKIISETLQGIRDIKINKIENYFIKLLKSKEYRKARVLTSYYTINQSPRFLMEITGIIAIVSIIISKKLLLVDQADLFASIALFVTATFRLMPSLNRIISSLQNINYFNNSLNVINNYIKGSKNEFDAKSKINFKSKLELKDLSFKYNKSPVLKKLNLTVNKGDFIGLIGESGSGKSTLIDIITGLLKPQEGTIKIDNKTTNQLYQNYDEFAYVPQQVFLLNDSIKNNITLEFDTSKINNKRLKNILFITQLELYIKSLEKGVESIVGERGAKLSGGQIQRIGIARALYRQPKILILDEATSALDEKTENTLLNKIIEKKGDLTIISISHRVSTLKNCDRIYKMIDGKLTQYKYD